MIARNSFQFISGRRRPVFLMVLLAICFIVNISYAVQDQTKYSFVISTASAKGGAVYWVYPGHFVTVHKTYGDVAEVGVVDPSYNAYASIPANVIFYGTVDEVINVIGRDVSNAPVDVLMRIAWGTKNEELFNLIISSRASEVIEYPGIGDGGSRSNTAGMEALGLLYLNAMGKKDYQHALGYLKTCGEKFPNDWWPYLPTEGPCFIATQFGVADVYMQMGRFLEAEKTLFDIAISSYIDVNVNMGEDPAGSRALYSLRNMWSTSKLSNEAKVKKLDSLAGRIKDPSLLAEMLLMKSEYLPANSLTYENILLDVVNGGGADYVVAKAVFKLARLYENNKSLGKLRALCVKIVNNSEAALTKRVAHYFNGKLLFNAGEYQKAFDSLATAILLEPGFVLPQEFGEDGKRLHDNIRELLQKIIAQDANIVHIFASLLYYGPKCDTYGGQRKNVSLYILSRELRGGKYWYHVLSLKGEDILLGWVPDDVESRDSSEKCFRWSQRLNTESQQTH